VNIGKFRSTPMLKKEHLKTKPVCKVTFTLPEAVKAETVYLVGDFNEWNETKTRMKKLKNGRFTVTLELEKGREYQFRYLVNGNEWHNDWDADKYASNPFGGDNSVVVT
jgi:1,4-alpha-glucan branching enzyme